MHEIIIRLILLTLMIAVCAMVVRFARTPARLRARSCAAERAHARAIAQSGGRRLDHADPTHRDGACRAACPPGKR